MNCKKHSDGQWHAEGVPLGRLTVTIGGDYDSLFKAASIKDAWDFRPENKRSKSVLNIKCLISQRSDRRFTPDSSFDLKPVATFVNSMGFDQVRILHPHSDVCIGMINNAKAIQPDQYVIRAYNSMNFDDDNPPVLISPDAGAYKFVQGLAERIGADTIPANKIRVEGVPKIVIQGDVKGKSCLIVDDIADGGRTFVALAKELKSQGAIDVRLYVTHGMFNFGLDEITESISRVYCTDSYRLIDDDNVTQYKVEF